MTECTTHHHACDCREAMFARAIEIADQAMTELLTSHARPADDVGVTWTLCDAAGGYAETLDEADQPIIDAVTWLLERKLCALVETRKGVAVMLLEVLSNDT